VNFDEPTDPESVRDRILARVKGLLDDEDPAGPVVVELRGRGSLVAATADELAGALDRPLLRLAADELLAPPDVRARALARLLTAAREQGGVVLVDGADGFAGEDAWLSRQLRTVVDAAVGVLVVLSLGDSAHHPSIAHEVLLIEEVST
jgi:hypothetical protein